MVSQTAPMFSNAMAVRPPAFRIACISAISEVVSGAIGFARPSDLPLNAACQARGTKTWSSRCCPTGRSRRPYVEMLLARMGLTHGADRQDGNAEVNIEAKDGIESLAIAIQVCKVKQTKSKEGDHR